MALATSFAWTLAAAIVTVISVPAWRDSAHVVAEMIARNPQSYRGWMYRARTEVQGGTLPEARADYDSALARFGDAPELLESAGVLAVRDHDEARATALLSRGLRGDPRSARMRTLLIRLYVRRGDAASAARVAEEGLALDATQRDWRRWLDSLRTAR